MSRTNQIELLAPAGNMDCVNTAFYFGADAVYLALKQKSLRAFADNFDFDELKTAVQTAHKSEKKVYLTLNALFHERDFLDFDVFLEQVKECGVDAVIVSDLGVLSFVRKKLPDIEIHLSTQANLTNSYAVNLAHELGVKRIILARELTLIEISQIRDKINLDIELEVFVHGAMCISYSGRCLLSGFVTGRCANTGECVQPCRWEYFVHEKKREGQYFPVLEDDRGTYIFNSKDLMMIEHIGKLYAAGITSLKIEGRMKSEYYVGTVVHAYRRAIDLFLSGKPYDQQLTIEAAKAGTREFTTGFFFGNPMEEGQSLDSDRHPLDYLFAAKIIGDADIGEVLIQQRNKFSLGDTLEIVSPDINGEIKVERIINMDNEEMQSAPHAMQTLKINCDKPLKSGDMLRIRSVLGVER